MIVEGKKGDAVKAHNENYSMKGVATRILKPNWITCRHALSSGYANSCYGGPDSWDLTYVIHYCKLATRLSK
jgi:hypothetical protein